MAIGTHPTESGFQNETVLIAAGSSGESITQKWFAMPTLISTALLNRLRTSHTIFDGGRLPRHP